MNNSGESAQKVIGRPFQKGESGNPNGRPPKEWTWRSLLLEAAEEAGENGEPVKKLIAKALVKKAMMEDVSAIKEFGDRIDGKSKQGVELSGPNGGDIPVIVTVKYE